VPLSLCVADSFVWVEETSNKLNARVLKAGAGAKHTALMEECAICTEVLGAPDRPAAQLPCGHAFCCACVEEWTRSGRSDCPHCRVEFRKSKVRELCPWRGGLRLRQPSEITRGAERALEAARDARAQMERRVKAAMAECRKLQAQLQPDAAAARHAAVRDATTDAEGAASSAVADPTGPLTANPSAPAPAGAVAPAPSALTTRGGPVAGAPAGNLSTACALHVADDGAHTKTVVSAPTLAAPIPSSMVPIALTDAQLERAAANRAAALKRKRERETLRQHALRM
jgi:hypothetical protein